MSGETKPTDLIYILISTFGLESGRLTSSVSVLSREEETEEQKMWERTRGHKKNLLGQKKK